MDTDNASSAQSDNRVLMTAALAAVVLLISTTQLPQLAVRDIAIFLALLSVLVLSLLKPMPFGPHARIELSTAIVLAAALLLPPALALALSALGPVVEGAITRGREWQQVLFNSSQLVIQAWTGSLIVTTFGWNPDPPFDFSPLLIAIPLAGLAMHLVNTAAVASVVAADSGQRWLSTWRMLTVLDGPEAASYLVQWGLAVLAVVVAEHQVWPLALLLLPGILVFRSIDDHARLRLRAEERLIYQAFHDSLTGLPNRASFQGKLNAAFQASIGRPDSLAILFLDLDRFKLINDTMGHDAGDQVLVEVAARIQSSIEPGDVAARMGGDEFIVLISGDGATTRSVQVAERIAEAMRTPVSIGEQQLEVTTSVGIAQPSPSHHSSGEMLQDADIALYQAKSAGRAQFALIDPSSRQVVRYQHGLESDLRRALDRGELFLALQPIVSFANGQTIAVGAAPRWNRPGYGTIDTDTFLPLAADLGLMPELVRWSFAEACSIAGQWRKDQAGITMPISLRVSSALVLDANFVDEVTRNLDSHLLDGSNICIEISDDFAIEQMDSIAGSVHRLRSLGIPVVLESFYSFGSTLLALSRLPIAALHLKSSLIAELMADERSSKLVLRAVISAAHQLDVLVVATGVETEDELTLARLAGCDAAQGNALAAPVAALQFNHYLPAVSGNQIATNNRTGRNAPPSAA